MEFKAGVDLNRKIAELLGFRVEKRKHTIALIRPDGSERTGFGSEDAAWWNVPEYSTDLNVAFTLPVEGEYFLDLHGPNEDDPLWFGFVNTRWEDDNYVEVPYRGYAKTGAFALCLAWLQYFGAQHRIPGLQPEISKYLETEHGVF